MTTQLDMQEPSWIRRQLRITWHLPIVLGILAAGLTLAYNWNWLTASPPRVVHLRGTHAEIGLAHGRQLSAEIRGLFDDYIVGGLVEREGRDLDDLIATARHYEKFIPRPYIEEMQGIARGAEVPYEHILVMNTFADAVLGARPEACSAFAVRTKRGLIVGRNLDWTNFGVAHRHAVVFILDSPNGHRVMSVGWPGMSGAITGMNEAGLTVTLNMAFANDADSNATPFLLRLREILERQSTIAGATGALVEQPRTFAANVMLASARENSAAVVEMSGRRHALVPMNGDQLVTTNFYQSLDIPGGVGGDRSAEIGSRLSRTGDATTRRDAQRALAAVCFRGSSQGMVTNQSVVFRPGELAADIALGSLPASSGRYYSVTFPPPSRTAGP